MATKKTVKDLAPKSTTKVKGGGLKTANDNITLVRAAKPKVKDLAPKKNPRGGAAKKLN